MNLGGVLSRVHVWIIPLHIAARIGDLDPDRIVRVKYYDIPPDCPRLCFSDSDVDQINRVLRYGQEMSEVRPVPAGAVGFDLCRDPRVVPAPLPLDV